MSVSGREMEFVLSDLLSYELWEHLFGRGLRSINQHPRGYSELETKQLDHFLAEVCVAHINLTDQNRNPHYDGLDDEWGIGVYALCGSTSCIVLRNDAVIEEVVTVMPSAGVSLATVLMTILEITQGQSEACVRQLQEIVEKAHSAMLVSTDVH